MIVSFKERLTSNKRVKTLDVDIFYLYGVVKFKAIGFMYLWLYGYLTELKNLLK